MKTLMQSLREAREAKGMTTSELAARTHILPQVIEGLEKNDFKRIPAVIYGKGFIKIICETLEIDSEPLIAQFVALYNNHLNPIPAPAPVIPEPPKPIAPIPPPTQEPLQPPQFEPEATSTSESKSVSESIEPPLSPLPDESSSESNITEEVPESVRGLELFDHRNYPQSNNIGKDSSPFVDSYHDALTKHNEHTNEAIGKFRDGLSNVSHGVLNISRGMVHEMRHIPISVWRISFLSLLTIAILALLVYAVRGIYHLSNTEPQNVSANETQVTTEILPDTKVAIEPTAISKKENPITKNKVKTNINKAVKPVSPSPAKLRSTGETIAPLYID